MWNTVEGLAKIQINRVYLMALSGDNFKLLVGVKVTSLFFYPPSFKKIA